jgi:hypothetical protein
VLGAVVVYSDADFAVLRRALPGAPWNGCCADHTWRSSLAGAHRRQRVARRGRGAALHGLDPDAAASTAHKLDFTVLQAPADKPHGLREAYIVDPDGYVWVPDVPIRK